MSSLLNFYGRMDVLTSASIHGQILEHILDANLTPLRAFALSRFILVLGNGLHTILENETRVADSEAIDGQYHQSA